VVLFRKSVKDHTDITHNHIHKHTHTTEATDGWNDVRMNMIVNIYMLTYAQYLCAHIRTYAHKCMFIHN